MILEFIEKMFKTFFFKYNFIQIVISSMSQTWVAHVYRCEGREHLLVYGINCIGKAYQN